MKILSALLTALILFLLLAQRLIGQADSDRDPAELWEGAWRWTFVMPDGSTVRPKLTLVLQNGGFSGTTSFRPGTEAPITNATLNGTQLRFQVLRERNGRTITTTYTGSSDGKTIRGSIDSDWRGAVESFPWDAHRAHLGVEGTWVWTNLLAGPSRSSNPARRGQPAPVQVTRVELKQDSNVVTGRVLSRMAPRMPIHHGSITNNEVYFELERITRETKVLSRFRGKQTGDVLSGTVEVEVNGRTRTANWEARRLD